MLTPDVLTFSIEDAVLNQIVVVGGAQIGSDR